MKYYAQVITLKRFNTETLENDTVHRASIYLNTTYCKYPTRVPDLVHYTSKDVYDTYHGAEGHLRTILKRLDYKINGHSIDCSRLTDSGKGKL